MVQAHGWIGVDLDGTLAHYDVWHGHTHIGEPILPMVERVKEFIADGYHVKIFTARISGLDEDQLAECIEAIEQWCEDHIGVRLQVTNVKDHGMIELYDDRARQVDFNRGTLTTERLEQTISDVSAF